MNPLRRWVLRFSPWFRGYYWLAVVCLRGWLQTCPQAVGLSARGSFARGDWVAGRSDLDLTVLLRPQLEAEELQRFWRRWRRFQPGFLKLFPMAHDCEFLCLDWLSQVSHVDGWRTLWGPPDTPGGPAPDPASEALNFYLYALGPWLGKVVPSQEELRLLVLERGLRKLRRLLGLEPLSCNSSSLHELLGALTGSLSSIGRAGAGGEKWEVCGQLEGPDGSFLLLSEGQDWRGAARFWERWGRALDRIVLPRGAFCHYLLHTDPLRGVAILDNCWTDPAALLSTLPRPSLNHLRQGWRRAARLYLRGLLRPLPSDGSPWFGLTLVHALRSQELCYDSAVLSRLYPELVAVGFWEQRLHLGQCLVQLLSQQSG